MDFIPEKSEIQVENIDLRNDKVPQSMVKELGVRRLIPGAQKQGKRRPRD